MYSYNNIVWNMLDTELLKPKYLANNLFLRLVVYSILFDVVMLFIFHITCPAYTKKILAWFIKQSIIPLGHYYVRGIMQAAQLWSLYLSNNWDINYGTNIVKL